jgi:hypothetical protein
MPATADTVVRSIGLIIRRTPQGTKAIALFPRNGFTFKATLRANLENTGGDTQTKLFGPRLARWRFEKKYGPGATARFDSLRERGVSFRRIGRELCFTGQNAHDWDRKMNPGDPKPAASTAAPRRPDITPKKIMKLIRGGKHHTTKVLAEALCCCESTLAYRATQHGIVLPKGNGGSNARTDLTRAILRKCSKRSRTIAEMAGKLSAAPLTVIKWCRHWEVDMPEGRRRKEREKKREEARQLARLGWLPSRIGQQLRIGKTTATDYIRLHGKPPQRSEQAPKPV